MSSARLLVARDSSAVYVRVLFLAGMSLCTMLRQFAEEMIAKGFEKFVIDLKKCTSMDSTFMGTLLEISSMTSGGFDSVIVINANEHNLHLLEELGLHTVLKIKREKTDIPNIELHLLAHIAVDEQERILLIQRAHQNLVRIDRRNLERFGPFLDQLAKELEQR